MNKETTESKTEQKAVSLSKNDLGLYKKDCIELDNLKQEITKLRDKFMDDNRDIIEKRRNLDFDLTNRKYQFSELARKEYEDTGNKKLIGGIGIRVCKILNYEPEIAFEWAKKHSLCLQLNKTKIETIAKAGDISFVEKSESVAVTFPKEINVDD